MFRHECRPFTYPGFYHRCPQSARVREIWYIRRAGKKSEPSDSLHQAAGNKNVLEFHGNDRNLVCLECGRRYESDEIMKQGMPPRCDCGSVLKPDLVLFGEGIPQEVMNRSFTAAQTCGCMLVVGTSAVVYCLFPRSHLNKQGIYPILESP